MRYWENSDLKNERIFDLTNILLGIFSQDVRVKIQAQKFYFFEVIFSFTLYQHVTHTPFSVSSLSFFFFWPQHIACRILVPWPELEPRLWQWKCPNLTTGPSGNSLCLLFYWIWKVCHPNFHWANAILSFRSLFEGLLILETIYYFLPLSSYPALLWYYSLL